MPDARRPSPSDSPRIGGWGAILGHLTFSLRNEYNPIGNSRQDIQWDKRFGRSNTQNCQNELPPPGFVSSPTPRIKALSGWGLWGDLIRSRTAANQEERFCQNELP